MRRFLLWTILGFIAGGALAFGSGLAWLTLVNTDSREGAAAMGVIFLFTPAGAVLGAIAGAVAALVGGRR